VPTKIQALTVLLITQGKNIAAQSKNGTGKTGAFTIGSLNRIDKDYGALQGICISHTRELNEQNYGVFQKLAEGTGIRVGVTKKGDRELPKCHLICSTQGTIHNIYRTHPESLSSVTMIIYDECDVLFTHPNNLELTSAIRAAAPNSQQILFSATFTDQV
jgi:Superfamily II DNA and RNA helicases